MGGRGKAKLLENLPRKQPLLKREEPVSAFAQKGGMVPTKKSPRAGGVIPIRHLAAPGEAENQGGEGGSGKD